MSLTISYLPSGGTMQASASIPRQYSPKVGILNQSDAVVIHKWTLERELPYKLRTRPDTKY